MLKNKMMKKRMEVLGRIKEAAGYQRKAVLALFPERTREHLKVIDGEFRAMIAECTEMHRHDKETDTDVRETAKTKKVEIM